MSKSATTGETMLDTYELVEQIAQIRADLQNLSSSVGRIADQQLGRAQDAAMATANQVVATIRQNPTSAVMIAAGLGFLFGVFMRR
jgi:ElaB/YqjD/DUF883 family membrane-anchored ribosome-binding protein